MVERSESREGPGNKTDNKIQNDGLNSANYGNRFHFSNNLWYIHYRVSKENTQNDVYCQLVMKQDVFIGMHEQNHDIYSFTVLLYNYYIHVQVYAIIVYYY